ncbi:Deazaflavin-dependent oxidoreductase, nitroreductase family [Frankia canadensis]|uniref:Deazaflavin-dependent oxidoreductase, nitroreductase family n=1 Tax=Frankia canadensis TaxID=1836972 RepID=A0A2I2KLK4_9ACTN|nr:nitroreductase/quinone reductase family protein [Frankia canadensis]SNQ46544.1 Deazaflavin-dependent oxidoreductase, nitroreductase family [Frankia canadensis]SOU53834.1 Deazaflavin-dependent oxidoreductase, nitroreductase family [Frankia canadensis]
MASDHAFKALNTMHRLLVRISGGRLGWRAGGMQVLEVSTTGRRSGRPHTLKLTTPLREGSTIVLVASRGGDDRNPDWYHNVCANPDVAVRTRGGPWQAMRARPATATERDELWPRVVADNRWYRNYQTKTTRVIPLVLLEPR